MIEFRVESVCPFCGRVSDAYLTTDEMVYIVDNEEDDGCWEVHDETPIYCSGCKAAGIRIVDMEMIDNRGVDDG